jgi:hypothetical protein
MKSISLFVCVLFIFILANPTLAVKIDVDPSHVDTYVNEQAWYTIEINNDGPYMEEFVITVLGPNLEWLNLGSYYVRVGNYEITEIEMYFYPKFENSYEYEILVYSNFDEKNRDSDTITMKVLPERFVILKDFSARKIGNNFVIDLELFAKHADIRFEVIDSEGNRVKYLKITKELDGDEKIEETIPIDDLLAGDYEVRMSIPEHDIMGETSINIPPVHNVVKKKEIVSTPFGQDVTITITNEGNVVEDYNIRETVQANEYVDFVDDPTSSHLEEDYVSHNWKIEGLAIGATGMITYKINRLPLLIGSVVVLLCVIGILGMGAARVRTPNIKKRYVRKRNRRLVVIEIRGSLTKDLKNVLVKDRVSPLGKVLPEFEGPKPIVREGEAGTELIWRLGDIKPRSEIYLSYKIRPLVEAQLKMPRAYLTYRTDDDRKIKVFSKQLVLE